MSTSPIQQALLAVRAQRKRPPKFGPYRVGGSAKRLTERQLVSLVRDLVSGLAARVLELVPETPPDDEKKASKNSSLVSERTDAAPSPLDLRPLLKSRTDLYVRRLPPQVGRFMSEAEREQRAAEKRVVSPLGIDVVGGEPWLRRELSSRGKEFSELCVDLTRETERRIASAAIEAIEKGLPRKWLRRQVQEAGGIGERRARVIARDQVGKLQGALHEARQKDLGIESYVWRTSRDERVAGNPGGLYPDPDSGSTTHGDHHEREGRRFSWQKSGGRLVEILKDGKTRGTVYADGHPGEPIQCLPGETEINQCFGIRKLFRRRYEGSAVSVVTDSGLTLVTTPNHPVLTVSGWKPLGSVDEGEYLVSASHDVLNGVERYVNDSKTSAAELFELLEHLIVGVRHSGGRLQFHDDGTDDDVEVVDVESFLIGDGQPLAPKELREFVLTSADEVLGLVPFPGFGDVYSRLEVLWSSPASIVRGASKLLSLLCCHLGESEDIRFGSIPGLNALLPQLFTDDGTANFISFGQLKDVDPGQVVRQKLIRNILGTLEASGSFSYSGVQARVPGSELLAQVTRINSKHLSNLMQQEPFIQQFFRVIEKRVSEFSAHVYNLETSSGYYTAQRHFILHNCRCFAEPVIEGLEDLQDLDRPASVARAYKVRR